MKNFYVQKCVSNEDASPVADEKMVIVCDGLGGTGQNKHEVEGQTFTSAFWGAKWVSEIVKDWFSANAEELWNSEDPNMFLAEFKQNLIFRLSRYIQKYNLEKTIKGKSAQLLPTTLAMAVYREHDEYIDVCVIWAGDSRVYLLSSDNGLQQLTKDDVYDTFDAMKSIGSSNMCNSISGETENNFYLNYCKYKIKRRNNLFLFAASDGGFDYLPTPMHFEGLLETAMENLSDTNDISNIGTIISDFYNGEYLMDDTTIAGVIFDATDATGLKNQYAERHSDMVRIYENPIKDNYEKIRHNENFIREMCLERKLRDLRKNVMNYICERLSEDNTTLKSDVLNLQCMEDYKKQEYEYDIKVRELKETNKKYDSEMQECMKALKNRFYEVYAEEYIQNKLKLYSMKQYYNRNDIFQRYYNTNYAISEILKWLQNFINTINICIEKDRRNLERKFDEMAKDFPVKKNSSIKSAIINEEYTDQQLHAHIVRMLSTDGTLENSYKNAEANGFKDYPEIAKLYREYNKLKREKDLKNRNIVSPSDIVQYVNRLGNVFVDELINTPILLKRAIPSSLYQEIEEYKGNCDKKDYLREEIEENYRKTDRLWKELYKDTYEYYNNAILEGRV